MDWTGYRHDMMVWQAWHSSGMDDLWAMGPRYLYRWDVDSAVGGSYMSKGLVWRALRR